MKKIEKIKLALISASLIITFFGGIFCCYPGSVKAQTSSSSTTSSSSSTSSSTFLDKLDFTSGIKPIAQTLKDTDSDIYKNIKTVWTRIMNLLNSLIIGLLIFVAICQILRINVNTYGVKKILPSLLLAVIAANFSFLICRLMIDLSNIAMSAFLTMGGEKELSILRELANPEGPDWSRPDNFNTPIENFGDVFWFNVVQYIVLAISILFIILAFLFFIRIWLVYFLVAISPVAFMAIVLPQTKTYFNQWWTNFAKWVFMPVASIMFIWLANLWMDAAKGTWFMSIAFTMICLYLAITTPFKLGGAVMSKWGGLGKSAWNKTGGKALGAAWNSTGGAAINAAKSSVNTKWDRQKDKLKNRFYEGKIPGTARLANAMNIGQARQKFLTQQEKDVAAKRQSNAEKEVYIKAYRDHLNGGKQLPDASLSRLKAKLRADFIAGERPTFANLTPDLIWNALDSKHALDKTTGFLKSEKDLTRELKPQEFIEVKAILDRARQLMNSTIYKKETEDVMHNGAGGHGAIIPASMTSKWRSNDIAGDLYASSAVGSSVENNIGPEIVQNKDELEKSILDGMNKDIDEQIKLTEQIFKSGHETSTGRDDLRRDLYEIEQLMNQDVDAAANKLKNKLGVEILSFSPQERKEEIQKSINQARNGIAHMDIQAADAKAMGKNLDDLVSQGYEAYESQMSQHLKSQAPLEAKTRAAATVVSQQLAVDPALRGLTAGQLTNSDHALDQIAEQMSELNANIGKIGSTGSSGGQGLAARSSEDIKQMRQMAKEGIAAGLNAVHSEDPGASLIAALNSTTFQNKLGETMKRSVELGNKRSAQNAQPMKVNITNPSATNGANNTTIINNQTTQTSQTPQSPPTQNPPVRDELRRPKP